MTTFTVKDVISFEKKHARNIAICIISMVTNQNGLSAYFYFVFLNHKVRHFANAYKKCLKRTIQLLIMPHNV